MTLNLTSIGFLLKQHFTLFVDESGSPGIKNVSTGGSTGASPYMTMGATLIPDAMYQDVLKCIQGITLKVGKKDLHCNKLKHIQIVYFARTLSTQRLKMFGVISRKDTLGPYSEDIDHDHEQYYNKCAQYLLEKVGQFMEVNGMTEDQLTVCFEQGNFNYTALRGLIGACRRNPIRPATENLKHVNPSSIIVKEKAEEPLLQTADLVAHALFKCVHKEAANYYVPEPRYIIELRKRFFSDEASGKVEGFGIKAVHYLKDLKLDSDVHEVISNLNSK